MFYIDWLMFFGQHVGRTFHKQYDTFTIVGDGLGEVWGMFWGCFGNVLGWFWYGRGVILGGII